VLKPAKYNLLYADFSRQKKNLNDLLAWQHVKNIETLLSRFPKTQGVLIDQFSKSKKVHQSLAKKHQDLSVIERPGAEADLAVATASILARYQFVQQFRTMSNFYKITFPKGAAHNIKQTANEYVRQYGFHRLNEVAKLHFKTTLEIEQREIV
jgi:ribonuclease HIII